MIDTVVMDLDHTVFDWTAGWSAAVRDASRVLIGGGVDRDALLEDWRSVHHRGETMEVIDTLEMLAVRSCRRLSRARLVDAVRAYAQGWQRRPLALPGVRTTLQWLRRRGVRVLGYSESPGAQTAARLRLTNLEGAFSRVICTRLPARTRSRALDLMPAEETGLAEVLVAPWWPKGEPRALAELLTVHGASLDRTMVIGDHLMKDIAPARALGIRAAWARYGTRRQPADHQLVLALAHWPPSGPLSTPVRDTAAAVPCLDQLAQVQHLARFCVASEARPW